MDRNQIEKAIFYLAKFLIIGVFFYFGIDGLLHPETFSSLIPSFIDSIIPAETVVMIHGGIEILMGLMVLFEIGGFIPYIILLLSFSGVVSTVSGNTLARDLAILGGLLLLTITSQKQK